MNDKRKNNVFKLYHKEIKTQKTQISSTREYQSRLLKSKDLGKHKTTTYSFSVKL